MGGHLCIGLLRPGPLPSRAISLIKTQKSIVMTTAVGHLCILQVCSYFIYFVSENLRSCHLASAGHEEIVRELLGGGADVNARNDKGLTPVYVQ